MIKNPKTDTVINDCRIQIGVSKDSEGKISYNVKSCLKNDDCECLNVSKDIADKVTYTIPSGCPDPTDDSNTLSDINITTGLLEGDCPQNNGSGNLGVTN